MHVHTDHQMEYTLKGYEFDYAYASVQFMSKHKEYFLALVNNLEPFSQQLDSFVTAILQMPF